MSIFLNIGSFSNLLTKDQVEKYNKIISWKEFVFLGEHEQDIQEGKGEDVEVFMFKTRRSYYLRFATTLLTGSPVVITKELGLDINPRWCEDAEAYQIDAAVVNLNTLKENQHITKSSKKWRNLPSYFCQWQHWAHPQRKLGPTDFKTVSFNLEKEYLERNKDRIANARALMEKGKKEGKTTVTFDLSNFQI